MKTIGLLTAWASEDWIEYAIQQALELVDELIISIGPFNNHFKKIKDNTFEKACKYLKNDRIKLVRSICKRNKTSDENKCATLNRMLQVSENITVENYLWILDCDEFYSENAIKEIKNFLKNNIEFDEIFFISRFFCINLDYFILSNHNRLFKIKTRSVFFTPTQQLNPKPLKKTILLENNPMFHYSMLTGEQLRGIYWLSGDYFERLIWYLKIYKKYDPLNEHFWMKKNQDLTGNYGFWFHTINTKEKNGHGLFKYNGKHPNLIENSSLKAITDFREYMKNKPNYKIYLNEMKKIIVEKKKFNFRKLLEKKEIQIKSYLNKYIRFNFRKKFLK